MRSARLAATRIDLLHTFMRMRLNVAVRKTARLNGNCRAEMMLDGMRAGKASGTPRMTVIRLASRAVESAGMATCRCCALAAKAVR